MSVTDPGLTSRTEVRGRTTDSLARRTFRETKPSFMTTEFWAMLVGVIAVIVIYNASDEPSFTLWRASVVATALAVGYMISRGMAKSGSIDNRRLDDDRRDY
jgi:hypothetical protein